MIEINDAHGDRHACVGSATQDARPHVLRSQIDTLYLYDVLRRRV